MPYYVAVGIESLDAAGVLAAINEAFDVPAKKLLRNFAVLDLTKQNEMEVMDASSFQKFAEQHIVKLIYIG